MLTRVRVYGLDGSVLSTTVEADRAVRIREQARAAWAGEPGSIEILVNGSWETINLAATWRITTKPVAAKRAPP